MDFNRVFQSQKDNFLNVGNTSVKERIRKLDRLESVLVSYRERLKKALYEDYQKPGEEVDLTEILIVKKEIKFAKRNLHKWLYDHVPTPLILFGAKSSIRYESKGVVLIIAPWNYPIQLTLAPLVSAIAAGNCCMVKPSEFTPRTSSLLKEMLAEVFAENEVAICEGGVEASQVLLKLPFNHIFFTGSSRVGQIVMKAAADHLSSITLELGGKSPCIVDDTANLEVTAKRIVLAKLQNNGQICITSDYILAHFSIKEALIEEIKKVMIGYYGEDASQSPFYSRIVDEKHINRLKELQKDATEKGDKIEFGGDTAENRYFSPTIISAESDDAILSKEEIFGPILPVYSYENLNEAIDRINGIKRPLALYIFSKRKRDVKKVIRNTRAGATVVNSSAIHVFNSHLPFGGINNSGMGASHGKWGFMQFAHARPIVKTNFFFNSTDLLTPPYGSKWKKRLIEIALKYL